MVSICGPALSVHKRLLRLVRNEDCSRMPSSTTAEGDVFSTISTDLGLELDTESQVVQYLVKE